MDIVSAAFRKDFPFHKIRKLWEYDLDEENREDYEEEQTTGCARLKTGSGSEDTRTTYLWLEASVGRNLCEPC